MFALLTGGAAVSIVAPNVKPSLLRFRGGAAEEQPKTGKVWVTSTFTRDHVRLAWELPSYLGSYLNPFTAIEPKVIESIMVTVNSINTCPYCTGLHGQLLRTTGIEKPVASPAVDFAKTFAEHSGRGAAVQAAYTKLVAAEGVGRSKNSALQPFAFIGPPTCILVLSLARLRALLALLAFLSRAWWCPRAQGTSVLSP